MGLGKMPKMIQAPVHPQRVALHNETLRMEDANTDPRALQVGAARTAESMLIVPMSYESRVLGIIVGYAAQRWERCARVQWRSRRNGDIFHAVGPMRWGRDTALRLLGQRILDVPWLYGPG